MYSHASNGAGACSRRVCNGNAQLCVRQDDSFCWMLDATQQTACERRRTSSRKRSCLQEWPDVRACRHVPCAHSQLQPSSRRSTGCNHPCPALCCFQTLLAGTECIHQHDGHNPLTRYCCCFADQASTACTGRDQVKYCQTKHRGLWCSCMLCCVRSQTYLVIMDKFVHAAGTQRGAYCVCQRHAGVDVADQLRRALAGVCAFFQQDDLGLLQADVQVRGVNTAAT